MFHSVIIADSESVLVMFPAKILSKLSLEKVCYGNFPLYKLSPYCTSSQSTASDSPGACTSCFSSLELVPLASLGPENK